ncbi:hypothetical protein BGW80DRAFT_1319269 [Lactifluus volemus]|nr:hypothetical protein BGW80DRAFT_1319269 [Lactifluus volemus]
MMSELGPSQSLPGNIRFLKKAQKIGPYLELAQHDVLPPPCFPVRHLVCRPLGA